jgi:hypothetical protein
MHKDTQKKEKPQSPAEIEAPPESLERLEDYEQTYPLQLSLFQLLDLKPNEQPRYSNTIELYDFMPKYHWGKVERIGGEFLRVLEREFECRGTKYKITVAPAVIKDRDGVNRYYYPSKREELVEDALRRLATSERGVFLDDRAGVAFTLYQLQQELRKNGHSYDIAQIKDALLICNRTNITVTTADGKAVLSSSMFETLGLNSRDDWKGTGTKTKAFVRFNSLVTESIKKGAFRQLDYEKAMSYSSVIARQLHKRMSHHFTQAGFTTRYEIKLSTVIRDFGLAEYARPSLNLSHVLKALDEMKEKSVLLSYDVQKELDHSNRNKLIDAKFILTPHPFFSGEARKINDRQGRITRQLPNSEKQ